MPSQYRAIWSTPGGGTGYSTFHCTTTTSVGDAQSFANAVRAFFLSCAPAIPDEVSISFDDEVTVMDVTGTLVGAYAVSPPANVAGSSTATYNRAAGLRVDWATGEIISGRRLSGRTYIVPCGADSFGSDGLVLSSTASVIQTAATTMITSLSTKGVMCVWSRAHAATAAVVSGSVPRKGAILRGRRD